MSLRWLFLAIYSLAALVALLGGIDARAWELVVAAAAGLLYAAYKGLQMAGAWQSRAPTGGEGE